MTNEERHKILNSIYQSQDDVNCVFGSKILLTNHNQENILLPSFTIDNKIELPIFENIKKLEDMDESVFAKWKPADIPAMIVAGGLGTLSSYKLDKFFRTLHDNKWARKRTLNGGHSGENIDWVPGEKSPGGFGHRWLFGHDLLNPFEVDWKQYDDIARKSGTSMPIRLKAAFYWLRHLFQDSFSTEGVPVPGNTLLRHFLNPKNPKTREILQILTTIKMRDISGAAVTNTVMAAYLWGTDGNLKQIAFKPNYRDISLMLGANYIALLSGLLVPKPSLNHGIIPVIGYYLRKLIKLENQVREQLKARDAILDKNQQALSYNCEVLKNGAFINDEYYDKFLESENDIINFYNETMTKHSSLKRELLSKGEIYGL